MFFCFFYIKSFHCFVSCAVVISTSCIYAYMLLIPCVAVVQTRTTSKVKGQFELKPLKAESADELAPEVLKMLEKSMKKTLLIMLDIQASSRGLSRVHIEET